MRQRIQILPQAVFGVDCELNGTFSKFDSMPIEHTHSFGRLIIKEAFTAMKKNFIIKLSQSRAVRSSCAVVCGMCFLPRLQFRQ